MSEIHVTLKVAKHATWSFGNQLVSWSINQLVNPPTNPPINQLISLLIGQLTLSQTSPGFYVSAVRSFENTVGKGAISPFPRVFSTCLVNILLFSSNLKLLSANSFNLEESIICCLGEG